MIDNRSPIPLSMKTTPRLFERYPSGTTRRRLHRMGGGAIIYQDRSNTVTVQSPRVPLLEWSDHQRVIPDGGT